MEGGLGQEEILHHQMLELGERAARMVEIGVRHRRVFALDIHAADLAGMDRVHDLDDGEAALGVELVIPGPFEDLAQIVAPDRLIVGKEHRNEAGVGGALHVVLTAQRMQARARAARSGRSISASAIRQRELSVPWTCWLMPMPQKMIDARDFA